MPFIVLSIFMAFPGTAPAAGLTNGGFETGNLAGWTTFVTQNGGIEPYGVAVFDTAGTGPSYAAYFNVGEVAGQVGNGPPEGGGIFQNITVAGGTYVLSADIATFGGFNADCGTYQLLIDGTVVDTHAFGQCLAVSAYRSTLNGTISLAEGPHEVRILITRRYGPANMNHYVDNVALRPLDSTPPTISVPDTITVNASSPDGAVVTYSVTASDPDDAATTPTCSPTSGSLFPIGTTVVTCTSTDTHGNTGSASFTIEVKGAEAQLGDLSAAVTGVGPGTSLADKVTRARVALDENDVGAACSALGAFINQIQAQSGKSIPSGTATSLMLDATRIRADLVC